MIMLKSLNKTEKMKRNFMTKYIVKSTSITYKKVEAESPEQAEQFAWEEPDEKTDEYERYAEVEEAEEDWV